MTTKFRRALLVAAATTAVAVGLTACSDSNEPGGSTSEERQTLTVSTSAATSLQAEFYLAEQLGYFDDFDLDVTFTLDGALGANNAAAGKIDLAQFGSSSPLGPTAQGRQMSVVYGFAGNIARGVAVGGDSTIQPGSTESVLKQLSGGTLVTAGTSGAGFGNATAVAEWVAANGGERPTIVTVQDAAGITAQLLSGQADACICLPEYFPGAIAEGRIKMVVPNTDPMMTEITGGEFVGTIVFGLESNLKAKESAVTSLVAGLRKAHEYLASHSPEEITEVIIKSPALASQTEADILASLRYSIPFLSPEDGFISEDNWRAALSAMETWDTGQDLSSSVFQYPAMVNMDYWNSATELLE